MTIIPIDKELCEQINIEYYKYSTYIHMLEFAKKNGYGDQYWELWNQFMEVQVSCNTLDEIIRIKYIVPYFNEERKHWKINFLKHHLEVD